MDEVRKVFIKPLIMLQNILENESEDRCNKLNFHFAVCFKVLALGEPYLNVAEHYLFCHLLYFDKYVLSWSHLCHHEK